MEFQYTDRKMNAPKPPKTPPGETPPIIPPQPAPTDI